jgi:hypothetical protein
MAGKALCEKQSIPTGVCGSCEMEVSMSAATEVGEPGLSYLGLDAPATLKCGARRVITPWKKHIRFE